jgi:hypothetical protein
MDGKSEAGGPGGLGAPAKPENPGMLGIEKLGA